MNKLEFLKTSLLGGAFALCAVTLLGASSVWANHFKPLSPHHTNYGVSQLTYGELVGFRLTSGQTRPVVRLMNPNHVTQAAAVLVYESRRGRSPGTPEVFLTCAVKELTPHAAIGLREPEFVGPLGFVARYGEVIWVPVEEVSPGKGAGKNRRVADGLGGRSRAGRIEDEHELAHPGLFTLPSDDVVPGQRQAAIDCVTDGLIALGLSTDIFSDFGIQ